jgi:hypothetical protein
VIRTDVERRQAAPAVEELLLFLMQATDGRVIESAADQLGSKGDRRAIRPLLMRLGDSRVQEDPDVEDAVCRALVALDVMGCSGNLSFSLLDPEVLAGDVVETIRELAGMIPRRYYRTDWI